MELSEAVASLKRFIGDDLTLTLARVEASLRGVTRDKCITAVASCGAQHKVLAAAGLMKSLAGQVNVVIHALGILLCLPRLLEQGEVVEYLSLGAGNTGRAFDLETSQRIAEFKFIHWQGGSEVIRQNSLFKDFYLLAENATPKRRYLYVLGTDYPLKFLNGGRSLSSVLSRNGLLEKQFRSKFGNRFTTVREYYDSRKDAVIIQDISTWIPELIDPGTEAEES